MTTESPLVELTAQRIGEHLNEIARYFKPGVQVTLMVRRPDEPTQDFVLTSEGPDAADDLIAMIRRRWAGGDAETAGEGAAR